jgi:Lrp/AsnC family transcriptional regulator, leucine-responsive regulatory protein
MKFGEQTVDLDDIDRGILALLQDNCRTSLAKIGEQVGLSPPSVVERVKKLEDSGVLLGYHAHLEARLVGIDVIAFIGVIVGHPRLLTSFEEEIQTIEDVLECHHVTGNYSLILKVKTQNTSTLERLISRLRSLDGVEKTETMVVLSTHTERCGIPIGERVTAPARKPRRNGDRPSLRSEAR